MEREFIEWLRSRKPGGGESKSTDVVVDLGDDAAVFRDTGSGGWVVTTDMLTEGVDFLVDEQPAELIGRKSLAVNLSDLAAMGACPRFALVSVVFSDTQSAEFPRQILDSILELAARYDVAVIGGDTNQWSGAFAISITAIGQVDPAQSWRRNGARLGDRLLVTGACGGSLLGRHLTFEPRVREAEWLREQGVVNAAIDISDGLAWDASQLAGASQLGLRLDAEKIPVHPDAVRMSAQSSDRYTALEHALYDGEDFELLLAVAPEAAGRLREAWPFPGGLHDIGEFRSEPGLWLASAVGEPQRLEPRGWEHGGD